MKSIKGLTVLACAMIAAIFSTGCASVQSVSLTSIPASRDHKIQSETSKFIVLGFNFNNDFIDEMKEDLQRQCPNGKISGILTKDEVIDYFLFFFWKRQVTATGYCQISPGVSKI